MLLTIH